MATSWRGKRIKLTPVLQYPLSTAPLMAFVPLGWTLPKSWTDNVRAKNPGGYGKCTMKITDQPEWFQNVVSLHKLHCHSMLLLRQGLKKGTACKMRAGHQCGIFKSSVALLGICVFFPERFHGSRDPSLLFTILSLLFTSMVSSRSNTTGFKCPCANNRRTRSCDMSRCSHASNKAERLNGGMCHCAEWTNWNAKSKSGRRESVQIAMVAMPSSTGDLKRIFAITSSNGKHMILIDIHAQAVLAKDNGLSS